MVALPSRRKPPVLASIVDCTSASVRASISRAASFPWTIASTSLIALAPPSSPAALVQQPPDCIHQRGMHLVGGPAPVNNGKSPGLFARQLEESCAHPVVKRDVFLFEPVTPPGGSFFAGGVAGPR